MKDRLLQGLFDRYMRWRLNELLAPAYVVELEYPITPTPRYGFGKPANPHIASALERDREVYRRTLVDLLRFEAALRRIPCIDPAAAPPHEPTWLNRFFAGLDAVALYGLLASRNPARFIEVGSGNSTKFARRSIVDQHLRTQVTSIDPAPRAEVDDLCDHVVRQRVEDVDLKLFDDLEAGDVLFVDNSHRSFMNSDVTVVFMDVLPRLRAGVLVHLHDIFLPFDYPPSWAKRHYSEQYLLGCGILAERRGWNVLLPAAFVSKDDELRGMLERFWADPQMRSACDHYCAITMGFQGVSFWMGID